MWESQFDELCGLRKVAVLWAVGVSDGLAGTSTCMAGNSQFIFNITSWTGDRGSTVVKVLCYKSDGLWFDPSWCQWILH